MRAGDVALLRGQLGAAQFGAELDLRVLAVEPVEPVGRGLVVAPLLGQLGQDHHGLRGIALVFGRLFHQLDEAGEILLGGTGIVHLHRQDAERIQRAGIVGLGLVEREEFLAGGLVLFFVDEQARIRGAHVARIRVGGKEVLQHLGGAALVLADLGQRERGDFGIGLDLQRGLGFAPGRGLVVACQRRLRQHDVGFHQVAIGRDQALEHGDGGILVLGAQQQLLHLEHHEAACGRRRFREALFQNIFGLAEVVGQDHQPQIVLAGLFGVRRVLAPQLHRGEGIVGLLGRQRHLGGALGQARVLRLLGQAHHRQVRALPVAVLERHLGLHQLGHHGWRHVDVG